MFSAINLSLSFVHKLGLVLVTCCYLSMSIAHAEYQLGQNRVLRFAVIYTEEPPYAYLNDKSQYNGIVPNLAKALGRELDVEVEFVPTSRKGLETSVIKGQADFSWLAKEWVENSEDFVFSIPVLNHREFLYSLKPFESSNKAEDWIRGKTICIHQDYKYPMLMPFFNQQIASPIKVSSQAQITDLFLGEKCDLLYTNEYRTNFSLKAHLANIKVFRSAQPLEQTYQRFLFNQNWKNEMPKINQALDKIIRSGGLKEIVDGQVNLNSNPSK